MANLYLDADVWPLMGHILRVAGHHVVSSRDAGRLRAHDEEQLAYAAQAGRILITHNRKDFLLLQRAWRCWSDLWQVQPKPAHAGVLVVPQPLQVPVDRLAREIDAFVRSRAIVVHRFPEWAGGRGWAQDG